MARAAKVISRKKKVVKSAARVRRGAKMVGPSFEGWEKMTGAEYHKHQRAASAFFYENYKPADLMPDVWAWMKDNKFSQADIRAAKAQGVTATVAVNCKLLRQGMPDTNPKHVEYWASLEGTMGDLTPVSEFLNRKLAEAIKKGNALVEAEKQAEKAAAKAKPARQNIQEIMRERAGEAAAEIEALYDAFIAAGCPKEYGTDKRIQTELAERKVLPQHIPMLIKPWERLKAEYVELQEGKDAQLKEGYARFSKMQVRNIIKVIDQIIGDLNAYVAIKQATKTKTVRARKPVPVEKVVARLKHSKAFKDAALKLDLVGLSPTKLHGCSEAWVYDARRRKMHHYVADDYSKVLSVKGNTVIGFDVKETEMKTLRKPAEQIKAIMGSRPAARKYFKDIRAVAARPTGRFNADMLILKAF